MQVTLSEIIVLSAAGYAGFIGVRASLRFHAAREWPSTHGTIICSEVDGSWERGAGGGLSFSYMYKPVVRYEYFVNGQRYEGDEVSYKSFSASGKSMVSDPKVNFPVGKEVEVFYNPRKLEDSMLETARPPFWVLSLPFFCSIVLIGLVLSGVVKKWDFFN